MLASSRSVLWTLKHARPLHSYRLLRRFDRWNAYTLRTRRAAFAEAAAAGRSVMVHSALFGTVDIEAIETHLKTSGYEGGLQLPATMVASIVRHARSAHCRQGSNAETFLIDEVQQGRSPAGAEIAVADVDAPDNCPDVEALQHDAVIRTLATRFLGYPPTECLTRLYWSPASKMGEEERRWAGQTIDYHYDIEPRHTLYVYFYLTDVDVHAGAHVLIRGSHQQKNWRLKLASTRQTERTLFRYYSRDRVTIVEGKAGFGFLADPACYHKALAPDSDRRLMLQLRIS